MSDELTASELEFLHSVLDLARKGDSARLSALIDQGVPVNLTSAGGDTLLILAAYHDHPATVEMLLEHGADTSRVNDRGQTALAAAVFRRSVPSVTAMLARGADPDEGERSATQIARFFGLDDMARLLEDRP